MKGKGTDPREWGNADLSQEDLDVNTQAAAFESFAQQAGKTTKSKPKHTKSKDKPQSLTSRREEPQTRPPELRQAAQIAKNSYLGKALQNVDRRARGHASKKHRGGSPSSSSSDLSESSKTTESDEDATRTSEEESTEVHASQHARRRRDNRHGRNKKKRRRWLSSQSSGSSRTNLKPIPPLDYDGRPDAQAYHRFVRESEAYLQDGKVRGRRKVFLLFDWQSI